MKLKALHLVAFNHQLWRRRNFQHKFIFSPLESQDNCSHRLQHHLVTLEYVNCKGLHTPQFYTIIFDQTSINEFKSDYGEGFQVHFDSWGLVYTMDHEVGPWIMVFFSGPSFMVRLLKKIGSKFLGPSLGVNRMWTKNNDHAPKCECVDVFLIHARKGQFWKKIQVCPFYCFLLGFTCLHCLLNVSKIWLANLLTTIFTKIKRAI